MLTAADFERRYRADPDPWRYADSEYEQAKYEATLVACGDGPFRAALELGGSVGVFSALLAPRCERLTTIDFSETAAALARERLRAAPQAEVVVGRIPEAVPAGRYDLVVASEILYYLQPEEFRQTLCALESWLASSVGRLVAVHWRPAGPERPLDAETVHDELRRQPWLEPVHANGGSDEYLLDVFERR